jgi:hypothetical protein
VFATYNQTSPFDPYHYKNNTTNATFLASLQATFNYHNIAGLPADLKGNQDATVTWSSSTDTATNPVSGNKILDQYIDGSGPVVDILHITRNTPAAPGDGTGTRTNLLTMIFTGDMSGRKNGGAVGFGGDTRLGDTVIFTSDFLTFNNQVADLFDLELTLPGTLTKNADGNFNNFDGAGGASFDADPQPQFIIPEPASFTLAGIGFAAFVGVLRKRRLSQRMA